MFVSLRGKTLKTKYFLFLPVSSSPSIGLVCQLNLDHLMAIPTSLVIGLYNSYHVL